MMLSVLHPGVTSLALIYSSQLNLFEQFLTQAVSGIDSTSITSGMQNVGYVILVVGFLWQVYQSALHGGDVRGLGAGLIKYVATAMVVMNYHAVFTTVNQGFVNAGNWISNASGGLNLLDNWRTDIQTQFSQIGFQNLWGLVTGSAAGLIDALLIIVAYLLYPLVIVIFGFFYILYGSILYIFGPLVISLMPLGATNRIAKAYVENVFIWNAWPILYGGFGALLSAIQMGQVGQMLSQKSFSRRPWQPGRIGPDWFREHHLLAGYCGDSIHGEANCIGRRWLDSRRADWRRGYGHYRWHGGHRGRGRWRGGSKCREFSGHLRQRDKQCRGGRCGWKDTCGDRQWQSADTWPKRNQYGRFFFDCRQPTRGRHESQ